MSWQTYVDSNLVGSGHITKGAILGLDGSTWATSPDLQIKPEEAKEILSGYTDASSIRANGLHIGGVKFFVLDADARTLKGKQGKDGVFCVKTNQAILVGIHGENTQPGQASMVVEKLADYLIEVGY